MKVVVVNTSDIQGGAARAAYRTHHALLAKNTNSIMLVQTKLSDEHAIIGPSNFFCKASSKIHEYLDKIPPVFYKRKTKTPFSSSLLPFHSIINAINDINPDIVHLHWICGGMISVEDISRIKAPIVWTMHDMWPFTGGCHYDEDCGAYKYACGNCKVLGSYRKNDLSRWIMNFKKKHYSKIENLTLVGVSRWIQKCANDSTLFKDRIVLNIPNPIDTEIYKPVDKAIARHIWNLPLNKKLVLFGAMGATIDPRKGFNELIKALNCIHNKDIELVIFGGSEPLNEHNLSFKINYAGILYDDISLATLYNACDVMIVPSLQENLSNAIMESLSCGTPVVAFDIGGNSDMIEHMINGYLANIDQIYDLANGIDFILSAPDYIDMCNAARQKVVDEFNVLKVANSYINLYSDICGKN